MDAVGPRLSLDEVLAFIAEASIESAAQVLDVVLAAAAHSPSSPNGAASHPKYATLRSARSSFIGIA